MKHKKYIATLGFTALALCAGVSLAHAESTGSVVDGSVLGVRPAGQPDSFSQGVGLVVSVSGNTLMLKNLGDTKTFSVDVSTASVTKKDAPIRVADIQAGDVVIVKGSKNVTGLVATNITVINLGNTAQSQIAAQTPEPIHLQIGKPAPSATQKDSTPTTTPATAPVSRGVIGKVVSVTDTTIIVSDKAGVSHTIDASAAKIKKEDVVITVAGIAVGDTIVVQGPVVDSVVKASIILDVKVMPESAPAKKKAKAVTKVVAPVAPTPAPEHTGSKIGTFFSTLFGTKNK